MLPYTQNTDSVTQSTLKDAVNINRTKENTIHQCTKQLNIIQIHVMVCAGEFKNENPHQQAFSNVFDFLFVLCVQHKLRYFVQIYLCWQVIKEFW